MPHRTVRLQFAEDLLLGAAAFVEAQDRADADAEHDYNIRL